MSDPYASGRLSLKIFWATLERRLAEASADELRAILRAMAVEVIPSERSSFLARLGVGPVSALPKRTPWENLLADIDDLAEQIQDTMEDAVQWEEEYGWEDERDSLGPYDGFIEALTAFLERTGLAFDSGETALALQAYERLLELMRLKDDYDRGIHPADLPKEEMQEAAARYLRAVYENAPLARRSAILYEQLKGARSQFGLLQRPVMLEDLI